MVYYALACRLYKVRVYLRHYWDASHWTLLMGILMVWWLGACAPSQPRPEALFRACDPHADSAVTSEDWRQALVRHQEVLDKNPHNCLAIYHLGYIWGKLGDRTKEAAKYEKAVQCGYIDDEKLFFNLGMAYGDLNRMDRALVSFERAVDLNPKNADNHFGMGMIAQAAGKMVVAERALLQSISLDPRHWDAHTLLARIFLNQGRLDAARNHLELVLGSAPENQEAIDLWQLLQDRLATSFEH